MCKVCFLLSSDFFFDIQSILDNICRSDVKMRNIIFTFYSLAVSKIILFAFSFRGLLLFVFFLLYNIIFLLKNPFVIDIGHIFSRNIDFIISNRKSVKKSFNARQIIKQTTKFSNNQESEIKRPNELEMWILKKKYQNI